MQTYEVLRRPLITEKTTKMQEAQNAYVFEVAKKSSKHEIKVAVEKAFKVTVLNVNVITIPGEMKRLGKRIIKTPKWKKAVVTLMPGNKIEFFEGV